MLRSIAPPLFVLFALVAAYPATVRAQDEIDLPSYVTNVIDFYNVHARDPLPHLSTKHFEDLMKGEVVKIRRRQGRGGGGGEDSETNHRVTGYFLVDQPRLNVWLAALDNHLTEGNDMLLDYKISGHGGAGGKWFMHVNLPWPITDREWVIDTFKGLKVAEASDGFIWEQGWDLADGGEKAAREVVESGKVPGLKLKDHEDAIYVPVNYGGWVLATIDENRTLMAYHVTSDVGGYIPDSWIATFAMAQLDGLLRKVADHSATIPHHYDANHYVLHDGLGQPIQPLAR